MANMQRCRADLSVHVSLEPPASERVIHLGDGDEVDLDEVVRPARPGRQAMTLGEAIGETARFFEPVNVLVDGGLAPAGFSHTDVPADTDFTHATITPIADPGPSPAEEK